MPRYLAAPRLLMIGGPANGQRAWPDDQGEALWTSSEGPEFTDLQSMSELGQAPRVDRYRVQEYASTRTQRVFFLVWDHLDHTNAADILARAAVLDV